VALPLPTFVAGAYTAMASKLQQISDYLTGMTKRTVKGSTGSVANTTLINDGDFAWAAAANTDYTLWMWLLYDAGTTGDLKYTFTFPTGATCQWGHIAANTAMTMQAVAFSAPASGTVFSIGGNGAGQDLVALVMGHFSIGATAGTVQFQWAESAADATPTRIKQGSFARLEVV
jgi:hypothetical protein